MVVQHNQISEWLNVVFVIYSNRFDLAGKQEVELRFFFQKTPQRDELISTQFRSLQ